LCKSDGQGSREKSVTLEYWFMLPVSILVATTAMASGVEGATFFAPIFILVLGLPPEVAIGVGLITQLFGFSSGLFAYAHKRLIDYQLGGQLMLVTVPMAILGTWLAASIPADILKIVLGVGLLVMALNFWRASGHGDMVLVGRDFQASHGPGPGKIGLVTAAGEEIWYTTGNINEGRFISGIGALFMGMIATGLGGMTSYFLLQRCRIPGKVAVATTVFIVAVTALVASAGHFYTLMYEGQETLNLVYSLIIFTIPGVIIGGLAGSAVASHIPQKALLRGVGVLFVLVAVLTLGEGCCKH
jgi:uncharacterized membrane protein YfcA